MLTAGMPGKAFAKSDKALDDRTIGHNPERLSLLKVRSRALPVSLSCHNFLSPEGL